MNHWLPAVRACPNYSRALLGLLQLAHASPLGDRHTNRLRLKSGDCADFTTAETGGKQLSGAAAKLRLLEQFA
jgi:hypothetical protein